MEKPNTFGEALSELMQKKHLSAARLAEWMNYRSKTSITRILRDEVRYGSIQDFMERLSAVEPQIIDRQEERQLRQAMEVSRLGRGRYQTYREIWHLMRREQSEEQAVNLRCFGTSIGHTLDDLEALWRSASKIEMVIVNFGWDRLFSRIAKLLRGNFAMDCSIRHYLVIFHEPGAMAMQMGALMQVLHDARYQGYYRVLSEQVEAADGVYGEACRHVAIVRGEQTDGTAFFQILMPSQEDEWLLYESKYAEDIMPFVNSVVEIICRDMIPLKVQYPRRGLIEGLTAISQRYLSCERERATCCLAPNICFELIPKDVLYRVMFDSSLKDCMPDTPAVQALCDVHQARYENVHNKRQGATFIFLQDGLERFVQSGCTTDHVVGMRPFTREERRYILSDVIEKCQTNPQFKVYILHPDVKIREMTLTTHEDLGVYMLDSFTQYDVLNGHSEAFVAMPALVRRLEDFFCDELIEKCAYSQAEGLALLSALRDSLKDSENMKH